jgi:hypothetical protein
MELAPEEIAVNAVTHSPATGVTFSSSGSL